MKMSLNIDEHYQWLNDYLDRGPSKVSIASYGIYAGITYANQDTAQWGEKYQLASRHFIDRLTHTKDVRIMIGVAEYKSCKGKLQCMQCEKQYAKTLVRIVNHTDTFDRFSWKISIDLHIKAYMFEFGNETRGLISGRNLSDASWLDFSIDLPAQQCITIMSYFEQTWAKSSEINNDTIAALLEQQGISEQGFNSISD